jgi:hypothetical protein
MRTIFTQGSEQLGTLLVTTAIKVVETSSFYNLARIKPFDLNAVFRSIGRVSRLLPPTYSIFGTTEFEYDTVPSI